jgi:hypothetical protein
MITETRETNGNIIYKDEKNREIMKINRESKMAIARYPDMSPKIKDFIVHVYSELTGKNKDAVINFLEFKSDENEFCA